MLIANTNSIKAAARTAGDQLGMTLWLGRNAVIRIICEVRRARGCRHRSERDRITRADRKVYEPFVNIILTTNRLCTE